MLCHLVPADHLSMRLFSYADFERSRRVLRAVDDINRCHGRDTVRLGWHGRVVEDEIPAAVQALHDQA